MFLFLFLRGVSRENKNPTLDVGNNKERRGAKKGAGKEQDK